MVAKYPVAVFMSYDGFRLLAKTCFEIIRTRDADGITNADNF